LWKTLSLLGILLFSSLTAGPASKSSPSSLIFPPMRFLLFFSAAHSLKPTYLERSRVGACSVPKILGFVEFSLFPCTEEAPLREGHPFPFLDNSFPLGIGPGKLRFQFLMTTRRVWTGLFDPFSHLCQPKGLPFFKATLCPVSFGTGVCLVHSNLTQLRFLSEPWSFLASKPFDPFLSQGSRTY